MAKDDFWQGRRVFLTGHTGFKGSWLSVWLTSMGAKVWGFSLPPPTQPSLFSLAALDARMNSTKGDVRSLDALRACLKKSQPEIVFHLAAQSLVRPSYEDPVETFSTNVMGTVNLLEAIRTVSSARVCLNVTSDKCYALAEADHWSLETDSLGGHDPYSASKGCSEVVTAAYRRSFFEPNGADGTRIASGRAGNVIGGGDWSRDRLIPDCIAAAMEGHTIILRSPQAIRPWQHVLEPLDGYLRLAEQAYQNASFANAFNFGPEAKDHVTVQQVVDIFCEHWGSGAKFAVDPAPQVHEAKLLKLDISKAREQLGWQPRWDVTQAIADVVRWHRGLADGRPALDLCLESLERFRMGGSAI